MMTKQDAPDAQDQGIALAAVEVERLSDRVLDMKRRFLADSQNQNAFRFTLTLCVLTIFGCGNSSKDEDSIVIPITPDNIVESRPGGGPQYSISQIRMHLKEGPYSGTRTIEIDHECVEGPRRVGEDPVIVIRSGPHIRSEHGFQGMGRTDFDIQADFLAPSELENIHTGESEAIWPSIRFLVIWLAIRDSEA